MDAKDTNTAGAGSTRFVTIDPIGEPRRVIHLEAQPERRSAHRGPRSCEELGICQGRYPTCGRCDDDHSADEPPTPTPFESIWVWLVTGFWVAAAFAAVGMFAGYLVTKYFTP